MIAWLTTYDYRLLLQNFAPVLVKLLRWLPDWLPTTTGFCCETLHHFCCETFTVIAWLTAYDYWLLLRNFAPVLVRNFYGDCLTDHVRLLAFGAKLCSSSGVKLLRWLPDWLRTLLAFAAKLGTICSVKILRWLPDWPRTTTGFCWKTLHQFWWNFYGDCLTDYLRLLAFAAKLCTSSCVKLLRWLPDWLPTTTGFCCETFHQF